MSDPNYSIPVWSSGTYFSEGDRVEVSEHSRHKLAGVEGKITDTKLTSSGEKMHKVKGYWYPERPLRPAYENSPERKEDEIGNYGLVSGSIAVVIGILIILLLTF